MRKVHKITASKAELQGVGPGPATNTQARDLTNIFGSQSSSEKWAQWQDLLHRASERQVLTAASVWPLVSTQ